MQKGQTDRELGSLLKIGARVIIYSHSHPNGWWWAVVTELEDRETYIAVDVELESALVTTESLWAQVESRGCHPSETFKVYPITPRIVHLIELLLKKKITVPE